MAITYHNVTSAFKVLANVRGHAPQVPVVVRTHDDSHLEKLQAAGATEVVPEALEGSLMLSGHLLALLGVPMRRVLRTVQEQREARYSLLRGYFHGADDDSASQEQERLSSVTLAPEARSLGQPLGDMALHAMGVRVVSVRLGSGQVVAANDERLLAAGDTLVLCGHPTALALAEDKLLGGHAA